MKTRPKKAKKYNYTKDCKEQPKEICDHCKKFLMPVCVIQNRLVRTCEPEETCRDKDKQYCHKVEKAVHEDGCKRDKPTKNDDCGSKGMICSRKPTQDCYCIPRKNQVDVCKTDVHKCCEKFSNSLPFPDEEQNSHFEPKKVSELEMKTSPKKAKKYNYTKDCKEQPKEIREQCEKKSLMPVCVIQDRLVRT